MAAAELSRMLLAAAQADRNAEQALDNWRDGNFPEFCVGLSQLIGDTSASSSSFMARQMGCLYLKNTLAAQSAGTQREKHERWKKVKPEVRQTIKNNLLRALLLNMPHPQLQQELLALPHFVALPIAEIAVIELPFQEWNELVPTLMNAVTSTSSSSSGQQPPPQQLHEAVAKACLECLGYTCERLEAMEEYYGGANALPELPESTLNSMLTTIVDGVQENRGDAIRSAAMLALKNSLYFCRANFDKKAERDFIMKSIFAGYYSADPAVRNMALQCIDTIVDIYYEKMQDYMTQIYNLTTTAIQKDPDEGVKKVAIEIWSTLATVEQALLDEERDHAEMGLPLNHRPASPKYVQHVMEYLVPLLLETLKSNLDDDEAAAAAGEDDMEEWTLQAAGAICLEAISSTVEGKILDYVMPFVQANIQSADWRQKDAAVIAFSAILEGPSTVQVGQYVNQSIPVMLQGFSEPNVTVRSSFVHCTAKMCKLHLAAIAPESLLTILEQFLKKLQETPRIAGSAASGIFNVAQSVKAATVEIPETNVLSGCMLPLMQGLLQVCDRPDAGESNLRVSAMSAAAEMVSASALDTQPIFRDLLPAIIERTDAALKLQVLSTDEQESREQLLGLLSGLIQTLYQRMERQDVLPLTDRVMMLLLQVLQVRNATCHEEAFMAIGAVVSNLEQDFVKYMQAFVPLLINGLRSFQVKSLCQAAVGVVVDMCSALSEQLIPHADPIMKALFDAVRDTTLHRDVKPIVISAFGDVAMAITRAYEPYLSGSTMLLMQAAAQHAPPNDDDMIAFINALRYSVLEACSGIIVGLADGELLDVFAPYLPGFLDFLRFLASDATKDEAVLQKAVALLGDVAHNMGTRPEVKQQLNQSFVSQLIREAASSQDPAVRDIAAWASGVVEQAIRKSF